MGDPTTRDEAGTPSSSSFDDRTLDDSLTGPTPRSGAGSDLTVGDPNPLRTFVQLPDSPPDATSERKPPTIPGFEILGELGRGGMGVVYLARRTVLKRECALKMILAAEHATPEELRRFLTEAEAVAKLHHPSVIQVYSLGEHEGLPFLEMEFAAGGRLEDELDGKPWSVARAVAVLKPVARAVAAAHAQGIVHRDLKPANILLAFDGTPKVSDFGLAKNLGADSGLTRTDSIMGSPNYMAPEQAEGRNRDVGTASDVYSLGVIFYELLVGGPPFRGTSFLETIQQVKSAEPVPPSKLAAGLPRDIETVILKCLRKDPSKRYPTAAELADDLQRYLDGEPILARPTPAWERGLKWARRYKALTASLVVAAVFLAALIGVWARYSLRIGWALEEAETQKGLALKASDRSKELAKSEAEARAASVRQSASLALDKGILLAEQGHVGRGMLWMARAYETAPANASELRHAARAALGAWAAVAPRPRRILRYEGSMFNLNSGPDGRSVLLDGYGNAEWVDLNGRRLLQLKFPTYGEKRIVPDAVGRTALVLDCCAENYPAHVQLWDVRSGKLRHELRVEGVIWSYQFGALTRDGRTALVGNGTNRQAFLFDTETGRKLGRPIPLDSTENVTLSFSRDGRLVLTGDRSGMGRLWNASTGEPVASTPRQGPWAYTAFAPDGTWFVTMTTEPETGRGIVTAWETDGVRPRFTYRLPSEPQALAFRDDGLGLAVATDRTLHMLKASDGTLLGPMVHLPAPLAAGLWNESGMLGWRTSLLDIAPDGQMVLTVHSDLIVRLWEASTGRSLTAPLEHVSEVAGAVFMPDDPHVVSLTYDKGVHVWNLADLTAAFGRPLTIGGELYEASSHPDGRLLALGGGEMSVQGGEFGNVWLFDGAEGLPAAPPLRHSDRVINSLRFSPDGRILSTIGYDSMARLWDVVTCRARAVLPHETWMDSAAFSPDGRILASQSEHWDLRLWDVATGRQIADLRKDRADGRGERGVYGFSPDSRYLVLINRYDNRAWTWEAATGRLVVGPTQGIADQAFGLGFLADNRSFLISRDGRIHVHDIRTHREVAPSFGAGIEDFRTSPDGSRLVGWSGTVVRVWDTVSGQPIGRALEHSAQLSTTLNNRAWQKPADAASVAFSRDGQLILTGATDGRLRYWDAATGTPLGPAHDHGVGIHTVGLGPAGPAFAVGGHFSAWDVPTPAPDDPAKIAAMAQVVAGMALDEQDGTRPLQPDEWTTLADSLGESHTNATVWHDRMAGRYEFLKDDRAALWHLDRLVAARPDSGSFLWRRSRVRARLNDTAGAAEDEARAASLVPSERLAVWRAFDAFDRYRKAKRDGHNLGALADLDALLAVRPEDTVWALDRSQLLIRAGRLDVAAADLGVAVRDGTIPLRIRYFHALLCLKVGDRTAYRVACADMARRLPPAIPPASANSIAWQFSLGPEALPDLTPIVRLAERAVAESDSGARRELLNTLGAVLYRAGRYDEAAKRLEESVRLNDGTGFPQDWAFLALARFRLGDEVAARRWLDRLKRWTPARTEASLWDDLEIVILRTEAESVIEFDPIFPADPFAP